MAANRSQKEPLLIESTRSPADRKFVTVASRPPVPEETSGMMSFLVWKISFRPSIVSPISRPNAGPRWLVICRSMARSTSGGSGVGPGISSRLVWAIALLLVTRLRCDPTQTKNALAIRRRERSRCHSISGPRTGGPALDRGNGRTRQFLHARATARSDRGSRVDAVRPSPPGSTATGSLGERHGPTRLRHRPARGIIALSSEERQRDGLGW